MNETREEAWARAGLNPPQPGAGPSGITDPRPADEPHGHWHVLHPLTSWQRRWHLNHFGDRPGHAHEAHGLGPRV